MMELCDAELKARSGIDVSLSGTTAVVAFLANLNLTVGSLGDSRCVLGAVDTDGSTLEESREIHAVQLSVDQKPHHQQELERIQRNGGKVAKLQNQYGTRIGPYRVWTKDNIPGLAMSRSIGDSIGHSVGVQSTPIIRHFQLQPGQDHFLVLASDGVWYEICRDVMDNKQVVGFLHDFKGTAQTRFSQLPIGTTITEADTTLAHLLCEEARSLWKAIVEKEDVMIDDISCIVLDLSRSLAVGSLLSQQSHRDPRISIATVEQLYTVYPDFDRLDATP
jgi:serine/threonine protein phosphatase PrpC